MSELTPTPWTTIVAEDSSPMVIDTETDLDEVYTALADERRRQVLAVVREATAEMAVSTIAERIAEGLILEDSGSAPDSLVRRLHTSLYHKHLPIIASAELITYDPEMQTVEPADTVEY